MLARAAAEHAEIMKRRSLAWRTALGAVWLVAGARANPEAPHCEGGKCYGLCPGDASGVCGTGNSTCCTDNPVPVPSTGAPACVCPDASCINAPDHSCTGVCRDQDCQARGAYYCGTTASCEPCANVQPNNNATCKRADKNCCSTAFLAACPSDPFQCSRIRTGYACGGGDYFDNLAQFAALLKFGKQVCEKQLGEEGGENQVPKSCNTGGCSRIFHQIAEDCSDLLTDPMFVTFRQALDPFVTMCERDAYAKSTAFAITDPNVQAVNHVNITECGGQLTDGIGVHKVSQDGLSDYVRILAPPGQKVQLNLTSQYLRPNDKIQIYDAPALGNASGSFNPTATLQNNPDEWPLKPAASRIFRSSGRAMLVRLVSDQPHGPRTGMVFSFDIKCLCDELGGSEGPRTVVWDEVRALPNGTSLKTQQGSKCLVPSPTDFPEPERPMALNRPIRANPQFHQKGANITWGRAPGPYVLGGPAKYAGGVLLLDGRVLLVPHNEDSIGLFDPYTNTFSTGPQVGRGDHKFAGGVLLKDGRVVIVPQMATLTDVESSIGIFDPRPVKDDFSFPLRVSNRRKRRRLRESGSLPLTRWVKGTLGADCLSTCLSAGGECVVDYPAVHRGDIPEIAQKLGVSCTDYGADGAAETPCLYDGDECYAQGNGKTTLSCAAKEPSANRFCPCGLARQIFSGGVLLPDGRVVMIPSYIGIANHSFIGIYDPQTNQFRHDGGSIPNATMPTSPKEFQYSGGMLLPDGRVLLVPNQSSTIGLYDPANDSFVSGPTVSSGGYSGAVLCPDGRVVLVPDRAPEIYVFDPSTDDGVATHSASGFRGGVLLRDGRVAFVPHSTSVRSGVVVYDPIGQSLQSNFSQCCPDEPPVTDPSNDYGAYFGAVVLPNGTVALVPYDATRIGLFTVEVSSKAYFAPTVKAAWNALLLPYYNKF